MTRGSARSRHERRTAQARPRRSARWFLLRVGLIALVFGFGLGMALLIIPRLLRPARINTPATLGTANHWIRIADGSTIDDELLLTDGSAWALFTDGGIGRLDGDHWTTMSDKVSGSLLLELPGTPPRLLVVGGTKTGWQTADHGTTWQPVDLPLNLPTTFTAPNVTQQTALWLVGHNPPDPNAIWLANKDGLTHYDPASDQWQTVAAPDGWQLALSNAVITGDGSIWVGAFQFPTTGALNIPTAWWRYQPNPVSSAAPTTATSATTEAPTIIPVNSAPDGTWLKSAYLPRDINAFTSTPDKALWLILNDDQLALLPANTAPDKAANWQLPPPLTSADSAQPVVIDSGAADRDGSVWWIDRSGGLFSYDGKTWQTYPAGSTNAPVSHPIAPLVTDRAGHLWLGGDSMAHYTDGHWTTSDPAQGDVFNSMPKVYQDVSGRALARDGSIWIAVSAAGLVRYTNDGWTWFGPQNNTLPMPANASVSDKYVPLSSAPDGSLLIYHPIEGATYHYSP
jgi:hypothetical protein